MEGCRAWGSETAAGGAGTRNPGTQGWEGTGTLDLLICTPPSCVHTHGEGFCFASPEALARCSPHHCSLLQFFPKCDQNPPFSITQRTSHLRGPSYSAQRVPLPLHLQRVCPLAKKKDEKTITDFTSGCQCCCKTQQSGVSRHFPSLRYKQYITAANRTKRFFFQTNTQLTLFLFSLDDKIVRGYLKCEV